MGNDLPSVRKEKLGRAQRGSEKEEGGDDFGSERSFA